MPRLTCTATVGNTDKGLPGLQIGQRWPVDCNDGVVRTATIINHPDTYFSVPARVSVKGKTVTGFVYWAGTGPVRRLAFTANAWMRNAALLASGK